MTITWSLVKFYIGNGITSESMASDEKDSQSRETCKQEVKDNWVSRRFQFDSKFAEQTACESSDSSCAAQGVDLTNLHTGISGVGYF